MPAPKSHETFRVTAWTPGARLACAALIGLATANLLELGLRIAADAIDPRDPGRAPLGLLVRRIFWLAILPWLAARVLRYLFAASAEVTPAALVLLGRASRVEVPLPSIAAVEAFRLPLPGPGVALRLRSGRPFDVELSLPDPRPLAMAISAAAGLPPGTADQPALLDAHARRKVRLLSYPLLILGAVPAIVTFILFRLHQLIVYGGLFGELYLHGLRRWLTTLSGVFFFAEGHLLVLAAALRVLVELFALLAKRFAPQRCAGIRIVLELAAALLYVGGVAAVLALRLLA